LKYCLDVPAIKIYSSPHKGTSPRTTEYDAMGQGTESCGGYDVEYDEYEECQDGYWIQRDGSRIAISAMSLSHLINTKRICSRLAATASFSSDSEKWSERVEAFDSEIATRQQKQKSCPKAIKAEKSNPRGVIVEMICHCGFGYQARSADIKRGWGLSCGKRCAAIRREYGRPAAKRKDSPAP
jgi:hypothetical protein